MVNNAIRLPQPGEIKMIKDVATKVFLEFTHFLDAKAHFTLINKG